MVKIPVEGENSFFFNSYVSARTDILSVSPLVLSPGINVVRARGTEESFPNLEVATPQQLMDYLNASGRSRLAQGGSHPLVRETIDSLINNNSSIRRSLRESGYAEFDVHLYNELTNRNFQIMEPTGLFKFYSLEFAKRLESERLIEAVQSKKIIVPGKENDDWKWAIERKRNKEKLVGIDVKLDSEKWKYYAIDGSQIVAHLGADDRARIDEDMVPLPKHKPGIEELFWVGETIGPVEILSGIYGRVPDWLDSGKNVKKNLRSRLRHTSAVMLFPCENGNGDRGTKWPVRVEILGHYYNLPEYVRITFFES